MPQALLKASKQLSVEEWFLHRIHALLGLFCLCHFAYRFAIFFASSSPSNDMGFESLTTIELICVFLPHVALQVSGLGFLVPRKRHPDGNRIWPQYRYEALVFCWRCLALMAIAWGRKMNGCNGYDDQSGLLRSTCSVWPPAVVIFVTMVAADLVGSYYNYLGEQSRTIRDLSGPPGALYLMSSAQVHANIHCLLTMNNLCVQLSALTVVQTTAFGMTLRRKTIISQPQGLVLYSLVLVLGMVVILNDLMGRGILDMAVTMGNVAALLRFELHLNKYLLWALMALCVHYLTGNSNGADLSGATGSLGAEKNPWRLLALTSTGLLFFGAFRRQTTKPGREK